MMKNSLLRHAFALIALVFSDSLFAQTEYNKTVDTDGHTIGRLIKDSGGGYRFGGYSNAQPQERHHHHDYRFGPTSRDPRIIMDSIFDGNTLVDTVFWVQDIDINGTITTGYVQGSQITFDPMTDPYVSHTVDTFLDYDLIMYKLDANGEFDFGHTFGTPRWEQDGFTALSNPSWYISQLENGDFLVGTSRLMMKGASSDLIIMRITPGHQVVWTMTYDASNFNRLLQIVPAGPDQALVLGRMGNKNAYAMMINVGDGSVQWLNRFQDGSDRVKAIQYVLPTPNNRFLVLAAYSSSQGGAYPNWDPLLIELDYNGNVYNSQLLDFDTDRQLTWSMSITGTDEVHICGYNLAADNNSTDEIMVIRTDIHGHAAAGSWARTYTTRDANQSFAPARGRWVRRDIRGNLWVFGVTKARVSSKWDYCMLQLDESGAVLDSRVYIDPNNNIGVELIEPVQGGWLMDGLFNNYNRYSVTTDAQGRTLPCAYMPLDVQSFERPLTETLRTFDGIPVSYSTEALSNIVIESVDFPVLEKDCETCNCGEGNSNP